LKIALIVNPLIPVPPEKYGGIERIVYMLICEYKKKGYDITLYANEHSAPDCKLIGYREGEAYSVNDFIRINRLTWKIAFQKFDLVHTFGRMSNIALLMSAKITKIVSYQLPPTVSQVKKAVKISRNGTLYFTTCSNYISSQINQHAHVKTIYNGVNLDDYDFGGDVAADAPLVFLGRIQAEKGTDVAIKVALKTSQKLIIAGNVPSEAHHLQYFNEQIKPLIDGEQIEYIGPVNNSQKNALLGKAKAFLMPVMWDEPFGIVMAEALACGTPVIGFKRGAVPEVIVNGLNGFVCETEEEMCAAVQNIAAINRADCRKVAEEKFSAPVIAEQYESLYREALRGN